MNVDKFGRHIAKRLKKNDVNYDLITLHVEKKLAEKLTQNPSLLENHIVTKFQSKLATQQSLAEKVESDLDNEKKHRSALKKDIIENTKKIKSNDAQISNLKSNNQKVDDLIKKLDKLENNVSNLKKIQQNLTPQIENDFKKLNHLPTFLTEPESEKSSVEELKQLLETMLESNQQEIQNFKDKVVTLPETKPFTDLIQKNQERMKKLRDRFFKNVKFSELEIEFQQIFEDFKNIPATYESISELKKDEDGLNGLKASLTQKNKVLTQLREFKLKPKEILKTLEESVNQLSNKIQKVSTRLDANIGFLQPVISTQEKFKTRIEKLETNMTTTGGNITKFKKDLQSVTDAIQEIDTQLDSNKIDLLNKELNSLREQLNTDLKTLADDLTLFTKKTNSNELKLLKDKIINVKNRLKTLTDTNFNSQIIKKIQSDVNNALKNVNYKEIGEDIKNRLILLQNDINTLKTKSQTADKISKLQKKIGDQIVKTEKLDELKRQWESKPWKNLNKKEIDDLVSKQNTLQTKFDENQTYFVNKMDEWDVKFPNIEQVKSEYKDALTAVINNAADIVRTKQEEYEKKIDSKIAIIDKFQNNYETLTKNLKQFDKEKFDLENDLDTVWDLVDEIRLKLNLEKSKRSKVKKI